MLCILKYLFATSPLTAHSNISWTNYSTQRNTFTSFGLCIRRYFFTLYTLKILLFELRRSSWGYVAFTNQSTFTSIVHFSRNRNDRLMRRKIKHLFFECLGEIYVVKYTLHWYYIRIIIIAENGFLKSLIHFSLSFVRMGLHIWQFD